MNQPYNYLPILLASSSPYRLELLKKTSLTIINKPPSFDEDSFKKTLITQNATPIEVAEQLSKGKANSLKNNSYLVIGGDQLIDFSGKILGKPKTFENAVTQLKQLSGHWHELITAITLVHPNEITHINHITRLKMRILSTTEIQNYVQLDSPVDCAGAYKIEAHGICLFEKIDCDDFTAIQGIPMIWLSTQLKRLGYELYKK